MSDDIFEKLWIDKDWRYEKWAVITLLIGLLLITGVHVLSLKSFENTTKRRAEVNKDHLLMTKIGALENHLLNMEKHMRNYILSNNLSFFRQCNQEILASERDFKEIEQFLLKKSNTISPSFINFRKAFMNKMNFNLRLINRFNENRKDVTKILVDEQEDATLNLLIEDALIAFQKEQNIDFDKSQAAVVISNEENKLFDNLTFILGLLFLMVALFYLFHSLYKRMLLNEKLLKANIEVEQTAKIKEQFLTNMSHEIRTPLQAILGYTSILSKEKFSDRQTQYISTIQIASENLLGIVNDILNVSKIESGTIRLEEIPFSLSGLLHSINNMFQPKVQEKDIFLKLHPNSSTPDIMVGDPTRLTQILVNLINNAIKFTDKGGIDIFTELVNKNDNQVWVKLIVKDTGIGIPKEKQKSIFDRFEQADTNITRIYGGSGLGLYIIKQLSQLQGGKVGVESEVGSGSTFWVELPYTIANEMEIPRKISKSKIAFDENFTGIKVLLVEDNLMNQRVVGLFLTEWGLDYDLAENGKVAIQRLENQRYDLVLMDVQMPEMDGYSATEYIRQEMNIKIPIIAMTAHAMAGEREKALSHGMNEYISKPVREEDLYRVITRFVPLFIGKNKQAAIKQNVLPKVLVEIKNTSIDYNFLIESSNGKREYLINILQTFLAQAPAEMAILEKGFKNEDFKTLGNMAHSLKSTIGYIGFEGRLKLNLEELEKIAKENKAIQDIEPLVLELKELMDKAIEKIKTETMPLVGIG